MENIAVHCSWADAQLEQDAGLILNLPPEVRIQILRSEGADYTNALAIAARTSGCTDRLFVLYRPIFVDIASRWMDPSSTTVHEDITTLASLARILPFTPTLRPYVREILTGPRIQSQTFAPIQKANITIPDERMMDLLLALFRLLSLDRDHFETLLRPIFFSSLLKHNRHSIRLLAIECLSQVMHFADAFCQNLIDTHIGMQPILDEWEGKDIDYRLLKIWEERRWEQLRADLELCEHADISAHAEHTKRISESDLHPRTALVGGCLLPRSISVTTSKSSTFVLTASARANLCTLGEALLQTKPVLVAGQAGSGKTSVILEAARLLNKLDSVITLHINEQTDAKSLIGLYTSAPSGDGFMWQNGVLTKAIEQGRWVLIEDIDRAPADVLAVLRPIIETGELFIPSRKQRIHAADGFRLLATMKTSSHASSLANRHAWLANERIWSLVRTRDYTTTDVAQLLNERHHAIQPLLSSILTVHEQITALFRDDLSFRSAQSRLPSLRDLLKWCRRINKRFIAHRVDANFQSVAESLAIDIFRDAVDCYASHLNDESLYNKVAASVAQGMNIAPQQAEFHLHSIAAVSEHGGSEVRYGRTALIRLSSKQKRYEFARFANTSAASRSLESISATVSFGEPCLLVGETGVGKTSLVQHIASQLGQKLTVINLSQQSEAADLLGGLKPVTTRSLVLPLVERFEALFDETFSLLKNERFQASLNKAISKQNWVRLLKLWLEAVEMANKALARHSVPTGTNGTVQPAKKRKLDTARQADLRHRWSDFSDIIKPVQVQIARSETAHTFAFVEGRLVQAVRDGEWVLLDEINLASSDTLDHIVSLLHDGEHQRPSVLLTEAGDVERVDAHPEFRVFAAMNPATDTGKKDLAPGIRSRFTELYVDAGDKQTDDLVKTIQVYLANALSNDKRAALDLAHTYQAVQRLNTEHKLTDGAGDTPHFSLRSLVRCLLYTSQYATSHGLRRAMYEGFAMSFCTVLSPESETLIVPILSKHLLSGVKNIRSFLAQQPKLPSNGSEIIAFRHHAINKGPMSPDFQPHYIRTPSVENNLVNLARAASMHRFPVLLQGPTSAGKTSMIEYLAKLSGNRFVRINNHEHTDLQEYLGSYASGDDGKLRFREGVLVSALREGHWLVLDELNLAPSDVLEALNRLLDDNRELLIPETQEVIRPHANFMLFATQNPAGLYGGRKRLSRAFRNRFLEIHFSEIPENELEIILRERAQIAPSYCSQIVAVYKKLSLQRQSSRLFEQRNSFATLRDLFRWASRTMDDRQQLAQQGFMLLAERVRDSAERDIVKGIIEETIKVKVNQALLYGPSAIPTHISTSAGIVWTSAMRRLFVLVSQALKNKEPVLLVGETGCGKTQICQVIASAFGRPINIYNAHTNTETGDLIGSQRPIRSRAQMAEEVVKQLQPFLTSQNNAAELVVDDLIAAFEQLDTTSLDPESLAQARLSVGAYQSLFAWTDGSLVRSMKLGEHFLLDEISLADDSVLERLNSVLEPARTILLAEKGSVNNSVIANSDFQFLATMNPGGDYGKRELSAALRDRLTEIWVPPLSEEADILPIVESKLRPQEQYFAPLMLNFALWFRSTFHPSAAASIPLRDLLAWAAFLQTAKDMPSDMAFVQGAGMVYIDSLGAVPAGMTTTAAGDVADSRKKCLDYLGTLMPVNVINAYHVAPELRLSDSALSVGAFSLARSPDSALSNADIVFDAPTTLVNTMRIARALQLDRPILLEGSPGVGKTAIVTALAQFLGKSFTRINLSDQTDLMDLFGADAPSEDEQLGRFAWKDGPLLQAMQSGGWVLLDEMNLATQSVLEGLNACLDHRKEAYIAELDKTFSCHPEFKLFAAQNPHHQGGGRKGLPSSFVNRFTVVYADPFQAADLIHICRIKYSDVDQNTLSSVIQATALADIELARNPHFASGAPWELNLRDVSRWLELCHSSPKDSPVSHLSTVVQQRFRTVKQVDVMHGALRSVFPEDTQESFYTRLGPHALQIGTAVLDRDPIHQHVPAEKQIRVSQLPQARSIITAITRSWPVVLTGSSGSGKSWLLRFLAAASGSKLIEISMNVDTDTSDLVGGFEQYDEQREIQYIKQTALEAINVRLENLLAESQASETTTKLFEVRSLLTQDHAKIAAVLQGLRSLSSLPRMDSLIEELASISEPNRDAKAKFVWNDGILVDAILDGSWVVLDNANLCNASVLDRLNSLLEPNGHLTISEQHNAEGGVSVVKPHPSFRVFLTTDPKHGELSRAMRNRSLEIYLEDPGAQENGLHVIEYPAVAHIERLRHVLNNELDQVTVQPFIDNLSFADLVQLKTLPQSDIPNVVRLAISERGFLRGGIWSGLHNSTKQLAVLGKKDHKLAQFSLLNEAAFLGLEQAPTLSALRSEAGIWYAARQWSSTSASLATVTEQAAKVPMRDWSLLQQSMKHAPSARKHTSANPPVQQFVQSVLSLFKSFLSRFTKEEIEPGRVSSAFEIMLYIRDVVEFTDLRDFDLPRFQALLQIGDDVWRTNIACKDSIVPHFGEALQVFKTSGLSRGLGLQRMWQCWRPLTPKTFGQLQIKLEGEAMITHFDTLAQSLPQPRKELSIVRKRLLHAAITAWEEPDAVYNITDLASAFKGLEIQAQRRKPVDGHFESTFDHIARRLLVIHDEGLEFQMHELDLFRSRHSVHLETSPRDYSVQSSLQRLSGLASHFDAGGRGLAHRLVGQLASMRTQKLRIQSRVREDLGEMASLLCSQTTCLTSDMIDTIAQYTKTILTAILLSHRDLLGFDNTEHVFEAIDVPTLVALVKRSAPPTASGNKHEFYNIISKYVEPAADSLVTLHQQSDQDNISLLLRGLGSALVHTAVAALQLMVPDRQFDPALYPAMVRERWLRRKSELCEQIEAQRNFNSRTMDQQTSLVQRLLERDLVDLGVEPQATMVARPDISELLKVQEEFNNVIRLVLDVEPNKIFVTDDSKEVRRLRDNIHRVAERLQHLNRAYDDIVIPVAQLLKCLGLGAEIIAAGKQAQVVNTVRGHLPLLIGQPADIVTWPVEVEGKSRQIRLSWLHRYAMSRAIGGAGDGHAHIGDYIRAVDSFYVDWKDHLSQAQIDAEAKSKYYAYRDGEEDHDTDARLVAELFPTFEEDDEEDDENHTTTGEESRDAQALAMELAVLHERLYENSSKPVKLGSYLLKAFRISSSNARNQGSMLSLQQSLPAILLEMKEQILGLESTKSSSLFNIYTDASAEESRKLSDLAEAIQGRFFDINDKWPEHAVPVEVISFCDEILDFKLDFPVAKLLTKAEKLLDIVAQWESVASREWSAAVQMDQLTELIVSWRKLELLSWWKLLDIEKAKQNENARAWYFIAYEAVIYNSRAIIENGGDVPAYCQELARTLEEFLKLTTLGQYSPRLKLLAALSRTLGEMSSLDDRLSSVWACVSNVIYHFQRYEEHIEKELQGGRAELEKAVNEQIKLASWKDTSVTALRDSARRSHHKLFKVVRKYRALLNRPVSVLKARESSSDTGLAVANSMTLESKTSPTSLEPALSLCRSGLSDWDARPQRLKDPAGAAASMRYVYLGQQGQLDVASELMSFRKEVDKSVKSLRTETPSTLTEDNTSLVRHLRERKRRLFADSIKAVAHMGVRRNLATNELEKQGAISTVLATCPSISAQRKLASDDEFHELLDSMPAVRAAHTEHSPDLTDGEVRRSVGLLEGLLYIALRQRKQIFEQLSPNQVLNKLLTTLKALSSPEENVVLKHRQKNHGPVSLMHRLAWLPRILELACEVLTFQSEHGRLQIQEIIDGLAHHATLLDNMAEQIRKRPRLPGGLYSDVQIDLEQQAWQALDQLKQLLQIWAKDEPNVEYLTTQLVLWVDRSDALDKPYANGVVHVGAAEVDALAKAAVDSIFVSLQQLTETKTKAVADAEDVGWLVYSDVHTSAMQRSLHIPDVVSKLSMTLGKLQHLQQSDMYLATSVLTVVTPMFEQFLLICQHLQEQQVAVHAETCRMACFLAKTFAKLSTDGYCTPAEPSSGEEQSGKLESGTGLGDGEGAEDISKDVGADEDMSEFAQSGDKQEKGGDMSDVEDAVDMGADELEGEMGDGEKGEADSGDDEASEGEEGEEMDEEAGSVNDLDPSAVDEKMWDDVKNEMEQEKDLKSQKARGEKSDDQTAKNGEEEETEDVEGEADEGEANDDEVEDEKDGVGKAEAENADPHVQDEQTLDLPEEMQLNGEDETKEGDISEDGMEDLSDVEQPERTEVIPEDASEVGEAGEEKEKPMEGDESEVGSEGDEEKEGKAFDDDIVEDQPVDEDLQGDNHQERDTETQHDNEEQAGGEAGAADELQNNVDTDQQTAGQNQIQQVEDQQQPQGKASLDNQEQGEAGQGATERGVGRENTLERSQDDALKKLADVLDEWHQRREIYNPSEEQQKLGLEEDVNMAEADFEHIEEEEAGDTAAIGTAGADLAQNVDMSKAIQDEDMQIEDDMPMPDVQEQDTESDQIQQRLDRLHAFGGDRREDASAVDQEQFRQTQQNDQEDMTDDPIDETVPEDEHIVLANSPSPSPSTDTMDASQLWSFCSTATHQFSLILTEQLRLILSPTTATKLRGDFRTGKRLNLKRIIPYIASGYKRDKIWMRRSIPSKRNYQILLAVDDSKSMAESGADLLALQTTAMLCKSLSMLEVGDVSVVSFGDSSHIRIAHDFGNVWTYESGIEVFRHFSFAQKGTNVRRLVEQSIEQMREARLKSTASNADELWQLMLIISDGHCSDHDAIRRLVRQAKRERIMIVFVILDNMISPTAGGEGGEMERTGDSILDLKEAVFEKDPEREGEMRVVTRRYLEHFPFEYYLVVRDVRDLPGVLARCLKGWFGAVVDT